jgi:gliding motility-associated-like protein
LNDIWQPEYECEIQQYALAIYNRWGQRIFYTENPKEGWNGYYKEMESPQGFYIAKSSWAALIVGRLKQNTATTKIFLMR